MSCAAMLVLRTIAGFMFIIFVFFFNDTATTEIYTLSLHDALPIFVGHGNRIRSDDVGRIFRNREERNDRVAQLAIGVNQVAPRVPVDF